MTGSGPRRHLIPKALYLTLFFSGGSLVFLPIFYENLGLSPSSQGILFALSPFVGFVASPLWCGLADARRAHAHLLFFCVLLSTAMVALIPLLKPSFGGLVGITLARAFFDGGSGPLLDVLVLKMLGERDQREYGKQRLWGAVAVGVIGPIVGAVVNRTENYDLIFVFAVSWAVVFLVVLACIPWTPPCPSPREPESLQLLDSSPVPDSSMSAKPNPAASVHVPSVDGAVARLEQIESRANALAGIRTLLSSLPFIAFLSSACFMGIAFSVIGGFEYLFLKEYLNASPLLLGSIPPFAVVMELPLFFFAKAMMARVGLWQMMLLSQIATALRVCLYMTQFYTGNAWAVLGIDLLHGFGYAAFWSASVEFGNLFAPRELRGTAQGLLSAMTNGLGAGVGSIVGGQLFAQGPIVLFSAVAGFASVAMLAFPGTLALSKKALPAVKEPLAPMEWILKTGSMA